MRPQHPVVDARIFDKTAKAVRRAAARADAQGFLYREGRRQVIEQDFGFLRTAIHKDLDPLWSCGPVVARQHVMPAAQLDGILGFETEGLVIPARDQIHADLPVLEVNPVSAEIVRTVVDVDRAGQDPAAGRTRIYPRGERELVGIGEACGRAGIQEAFTIEARDRTGPVVLEHRIPIAPGGRDRLSVLVLRRVVRASPCKGVARHQSSPNRPLRGVRRIERPLPLTLSGYQLALQLRQSRLGSRKLAIKVPQPCLLFPGRRRDPRRGVTHFGDPTLLRHVVEESEELIELLLRERVVLVVVAAGAAKRQAQPHGRGRIHAVDHVLDARTPPE